MSKEDDEKNKKKNETMFPKWYIKFYNNRWTIPWDSKPKFGTLLYNYYKYNFSHFTNDPITKQWDRYEVQSSNNSIEFEKGLIEDKYVKKQLEKTSLLSYLLYENGKVTIDELSPNDRFGSFVNNETKLRSMSVGKTMVSYVMGHAICKGYIDSIDSTIGDWSLVNNTLYQDQKIIDLLNMSAGDQKFLEYSDFKDGGDTYQERRGAGLVSVRDNVRYVCGCDGSGRS